jgi:site-specific recombinase XerD
MSQFSDWLATRGSDSAGVSDQLAGEFVRERRAGGCREGRSVRALGPLLEHLRQAGAIPPAVVDPVVGPVEVLLAEYARYAASERGLSSQTIERSAALLRPFLAEHVTGDGDRLALGSLTSAEVSGFMLACSQRVSPATVQRTATALRSLLGFLHLRGVLDSSLVGAVPATARWKLARLPEYLSGEQVEALLASCDLVTPVGRRDRAILAVLARLGLRAGEVAALGLDDIDWRRGEIALRGKGNRHDRLPLPVDVGEALVAYLTEARPAAADTRAVFIGARAPHRALTRGAVTQVVARASARAGLGTVYAHRLRHTAASSMLAAGGSLTEIGQVLRHQRAITTAGYAKVDHHRLRVLARPWPGDAA